MSDGGNPEKSATGVVSVSVQRDQSPPVILNDKRKFDIYANHEVSTEPVALITATDTNKIVSL